MAIEGKYPFYLEVIEQFENEFYPDISEAVISFSDLGDNGETKYIYKGNEKISFKEGHPIYQNIFSIEFLRD
ncbi:MAG: hypothetical protein ACXAC5_19940 [Promethearchaeota archaeon]|jgi:hypothetical protein